MKSRKNNLPQPQLFQQELELMLDQRQPLYQLANRIAWEEFEQAFEGLYAEIGRPALPIRLMVGLLILKQLENLSDERIVEYWRRDPYYQYFCGESHFQWRLPCEPSELVHFRHRIGESGAEKILAVSIQLHREKIEKEEVVADTTVQEKNITFPADTKLRRKIIERCWKMANAQGVKYSHSYKRKAPELLKVLRTRSNRLVKERSKARRKLKTYAGRLLRELERNLTGSMQAIHAKELGLMKRVLEQKRHDKNKIYSLHEPQVDCIAKGKAHKKYEFGAKASIMMTANSMVIVGAKSFVHNPYDGETLQEGLEQVERLTGIRPSSGIADRGYRGRTQAGKTKITIPGRARKTDSYYQRSKQKKRFARRAAIEPVIGHLKNDHRMARNYLKGTLGDKINVILAASAYNFKKWINNLLFWPKNLLAKILSQLSINIHGDLAAAF